MKKIIIILAVLITILVINKEEKVIIPKDSIRFRVIASSNSLEDQELKRKIITNLKDNIKKTEDFNNISDTRKYIQEELPEFNKIVDKTIKDNNSKQVFHINYGKNYFPRKVYKDVVYEEGDYESLVITLGEGAGNNFWCVLFPPLCLIDDQDTEYKSFVKEIVDKYF